LEKNTIFAGSTFNFGGLIDIIDIRYPSSIEATNQGGEIIDSLHFMEVWNPFETHFSFIFSPEIPRNINILEPQKSPKFSMENHLNQHLHDFGVPAVLFVLRLFSIVSFWSLATKSRG